MFARLVVVTGPDQGQAFALQDGQTLVFGRAETADARLSDPFASRTHCRVEVQQGKVRLIDAGSRSGTLVNGQQISQCELQPGDVVKLGYTELLFQLEAHDHLADGTRAPSDGAGPSEPPSASGITVLLGLAGKKIAQFEVQQKLATGCSGMVFRARDAERDRPVALKVLWPDTMKDEEAVGRFVRAMKTMLPVRHPNIVELYGAGRSGPYCWIAMEYVEGESLTQVILRSSRGGMLGWEQAFRVAVHVTRALQAAFARDIIHRNITPANILVRSADQVVKLGDLLLAKALAGAMARRITHIGDLVGDVQYMSPESTRSGVEVDGRSDIFSLGATVYAVLTGHTPFEGQTLTEVIGKIRDSDPAPPTSYQSGIPEDFERLVLRMLAKDPADRPQTPTDLLRDLDRVGSREGIHA
jgi:serine/threonine protein kinase